MKMKINLRVRNMIISSIVALITLAAVLTIYNYFVYPIQEHEQDKFLDLCDEKGWSCTADPNMAIPLILGIVPFMIYVMVYLTLQKKNEQQKTWRSYR